MQSNIAFVRTEKNNKQAQRAVVAKPQYAGKQWKRTDNKRTYALND